ncbi:hypothetical protein NXS19_002363 [Fusarium pseudograminearum]|nr:hypothetical protein NXS19_002363 [Fusarium pseudograminearum]
MSIKSCGRHRHRPVIVLSLARASLNQSITTAIPTTDHRRSPAVDIRGTPPFAPVTDRVAAPNCPSTTMIASIVDA